MGGGSRRLHATYRLHGGRAWSALFTILILCASARAKDAQHASETFAMSIPRQPLDSALQQLAHQCGVQMIFFSRVTEGLTAPPIEGDYTLSGAMERLLAGSGLTSRVIAPQMIEVRPLQARAIDRSRSLETPAATEAQSSTPEEVVVIGLAEQLVATRIATPLREIPQTVSIVSGEQMHERNEFVLADVLEHAPGITAARTTSLDQRFYARAYEITSFHIDGGAAVIPSSELTGQLNQLFLGTPDLMEFDHVEILRGADGLFSGNGNPGGTISMVRKSPLQHFALELAAAAGSWDTRRLAMDITGPIALNGALRGRATAVHADNGYFYDIDPHKRNKLFAALEYDLTPKATVTAGASHQWDGASAVGNGLPFYADGRDSRLPRDTALALDWARYRSQLSGVYLQYRQELSDQWMLKLNASRWRNEAKFAIGQFNGRIDPVTNELNRRPIASFSVSPTIHTQGTTDVTVTGTLERFGWREEVAIGTDFTHLQFRSDDDEYSAAGALLRDPRAFDPRGYPDPRLRAPPDSEDAATASVDRWGMFASLRIYFDDAWSIVGGARLSGDSAHTQSTSRLPFAPDPVVVSGRLGTDHVLTPYAGLMYAFDRHYSLYASYADIYRAQDSLFERTPGHLVGAVRGVNTEAGIKGEWRDGALNGLLALYRVEQSNLPAPASSFADPPLAGIPACCYTSVSSKSRGVDTELSGELAPGWNVGLGYSYNLNESPTHDPLSTFTPKHLLKAWTSVGLPGTFSRWRIGGSLHAQSETTTRSGAPFCPAPTFECIPVEAVQPAYAVLDLRASFDVDRNWKVALSLNNALDRIYYQSSNFPTLRFWYGEPRNWMLRIDATY